jgi:predicted nucleic acid-binding protein
VRIIVDANIIFSAILNTNSKIGDLLINSKKHLDFIAPDFLRIEIRKHYSKIGKISGLTLEQIQEAEFQIYKDITFISEEQIKTSIWLEAEKLVMDVDPKDIQYVAYAKYFKCKIWSGDKALIKGLAKKNFKRFITTDELFRHRNKG